jgi:ABC-type sugar transport system permease subunit
LRRGSAWNRRLTPWLFVAPALVPGVVFYLLPGVISLVLSFTSWNLLSRWVGLANYAYLLGTDPNF